MGKGFNIPWVIFGMGLGWAIHDFNHGAHLPLLVDLVFMAGGYALAERRSDLFHVQ